MPVRSKDRPRGEAEGARVEHGGDIGLPRRRRRCALEERLPGHRHRVPAAQLAGAAEEHGILSQERHEGRVVAVGHGPGEGLLGGPQLGRELGGTGRIRCERGRRQAEGHGQDGCDQRVGKALCIGSSVV